MADEVLIEQRGKVLIITLNRPDSMNSINTELCQGLLAATARLDSEASLTAGVLHGVGRGFSAGMDLKAYSRVGMPRGLIRFVKQGSAKPLVAAIEGFALAGGLEFALTCDLIVAARGSKLGIPETSKGLVAAAGGMMRLLRRLPYGVAMEMALTGDPISAEQAFDHGLVARLADPGCALDEALALAERIARNAPLAVSASKQVLRYAQGLTEAEFWVMQKELSAPVFDSADAKEGARAFAEKSSPVWTGR